MRPPLLNPLFAGAAGLKGIGEKLDKLLARFLRPSHGAAGETTRILDLLFHLPSGIVDRRFRPRIADLPREGVVTVEVTVGSTGRRRRSTSACPIASMSTTRPESSRWCSSTPMPTA